MKDLCFAEALLAGDVRVVTGHSKHLFLEVLGVVAAEVVDMKLAVFIAQDDKFLDAVIVVKGEELGARDTGGCFDEVPLFKAHELIMLF